MSNPAHLTPNIQEEITVRSIKPKEFSQLFELFNEAFRKEIEIFGFDPSRFFPAVRLYRLVYALLPIVRVFQKELPAIFVATIGGRMVGYISSTPLGDGVWNLSSMAILREARGRGIGLRLMQEALRDVKVKNGRIVLVDVWADNQASLNMCKKLEFTIYEKQALLLSESIKVPSVKRSTGIQVREFRRADAEQVVTMYQGLYPKGIWRKSMHLGDHVGFLQASLMNTLTSSKTKEFVVEQKGRITGYARLSFTSPREMGKIDFFCLLPSDTFAEVATYFAGELLEFFASINIQKVTANICEELQEVIEIFGLFHFKQVTSVYLLEKKLA
jgi:ribosomal protein S18 acetylase RimI-like enzyme